MEKFELRDFEIEVIKGFKSLGGGKAEPRKGVWIRGHLISKEPEGDYVYSMFKGWLDFCKVAFLEFKAEIEPGDYTAFKTYVWLLKKFRLIVPTHTERGKSTQILRQYYRVNKVKLVDSRWLNPFAEYPSWQRQKKEGFPKKRKPKGRRGRPPKYFGGSL